MIRKASFPYVVDESRIGERMGLSIESPIRVFNLSILGIDTEAFLRTLVPTFSLGAWDEYDVKRNQVQFLQKCRPEAEKRLQSFLADYYEGRVWLDAIAEVLQSLSNEERWRFERIHPYRKRSIARFTVERQNTRQRSVPDWKITRLWDEIDFMQQLSTGSGEYRKWRRRFIQMPAVVSEGCYEFKLLLHALSTMVDDCQPGVAKLSIIAHQVSVFVDGTEEGDNAPEGIHQDGSDYIVSALVTERDGIIGAESVVYGPDKETEYLRMTLYPGQGIFQSDAGTDLWHDVTPARDDPATLPTFGKRSIFGFDIRVVA